MDLVRRGKVHARPERVCLHLHGAASASEVADVALPPLLENLDLAELAGEDVFRKPLTDDDIEASTTGGNPIGAIVLLVGLGASSMSTFAFKGRHVLGNGFHRAFALRSLGVTHIPLVIQSVANPQFEFPPTIADFPREYLLGVLRPSLVKDFFNPALTRELRTKAQNKVVQVQWNAN